MNQAKRATLLPIVLLVLLVGLGGCAGPGVKPPVQTPPPVTTPPSTTQPEASIEYRNDEYGFTFSLPLGWKGYSVVAQSWEGNPIDVPTGPKVTGPELLIRHPLWTAENPRQDIPIMVFTPDQWDLVQQEKLSLGAAPIGPSELGRNSKYVFGLPARYNFAFPTGFEEVQSILDGKPLHTF